MSEKETKKPEVTEAVKSEGGDMKIKSKPKKFSTKKDEPVKVDLTKKVEEPKKVEIKKEQDAIQIGETKEVPVGDKPEVSKEVDGEVRVSDTNEVQKSESPLIEVTEESKPEVKKLEQKVKEAKRDEQVLGRQLPENIEKLVTFMEDTGGTVEDYVRLNADYSNVDEKALLKEYYKKNKPHLDSDDINLILEDYEWDEDIHEEKEIRKKKLAFKEEVAKARTYLDDLKVKYYDEIKLRPGVTQEQQKAMDFFNRYNKQQEHAEQLHTEFKKRTKQLFDENFKGFDFEVGGKKYKYNIQNRDAVAENQSNIENLIGKFLDADGNVVDPSGYHKAMYAASNVDKIATHFYEQGKADAVKDVVNKSKNLSDVKARQGNTGEVFIGGMKVKSISGADSTKLKIKTRKFN